MKLRQTIINKLLADRAFRLRVAMALSFSEVWIDKLISANKENGPLTTAKSLQVIREETGLQDDKILIESKVKEPQN